MGAYEDRPKLLWSLSGQGISSTISANGSSGTWGDIAPASFPSSAVSLDLASDFQLMFYATGKTGTPALTVGLGYYDSLGHLFAPTTLQVTPTLTSFPATAVLNAGVRAGSSGTTYFAFPMWGQVYWTITGGGSVTGVNVELWGK